MEEAPPSTVERTFIATSGEPPCIGGDVGAAREHKDLRFLLLSTTRYISVHRVWGKDQNTDRQTLVAENLFFGGGKGEVNQISP